MAAKDRPRTATAPHRVLREIYRHYLEYRDLVMSPSGTGSDDGKTSSSVKCDHGVIEYGYFIYEDDGETIKERVLITLSFWDLQGALETLSPRKREAVFYNVILDWKQKDVAAQMDITTVSVGQYVEQAMLQLSKDYFAELYEQGKGSDVRAGEKLQQPRPGENGG